MIFFYFEPGKSFWQKRLSISGEPPESYAKVDSQVHELQKAGGNHRHLIATVCILAAGMESVSVASDVNQHISNFVHCEPCLSLLYAIADRFGTGQGGVIYKIDGADQERLRNISKWPTLLLRKAKIPIEFSCQLKVHRIINGSIKDSPEHRLRRHDAGQSGYSYIQCTARCRRHQMLISL